MYKKTAKRDKKGKIIQQVGQEACMTWNRTLCMPPEAWIIAMVVECCHPKIRPSILAASFRKMHRSRQREGCGLKDHNIALRVFELGLMTGSSIQGPPKHKDSARQEMVWQYQGGWSEAAGTVQGADELQGKLLLI